LNFILASKFEKELASAFQALEQRIRKLAKKLNLDVTDDDSTKYILDDLNYDEHIDDDTFYELIGIWPIRDELLDGDIETIRRTYTSNELTETFAVVEDHIRLMDKLI
jgi:NADP-dependent 3-hydroxy acid dehydrogenase YdfG